MSSSSFGLKVLVRKVFHPENRVILFEITGLPFLSLFIFLKKKVRIDFLKGKGVYMMLNILKPKV